MTLGPARSRAEVDLGVTIGAEAKAPLALANPVMAAAGTLGYGVEYARFIDLERLGAVVSPSVSLAPRRGRAGWSMAESAAGVVWAPGLANVGLRRLLRRYAPIWAGWRTPVVVSLAADAADEFARLAAELDGAPGVSGLEVNLSWRPRLPAEGPAQGEEVEEVTRAVRAQTGLPVLVKLPMGAEVVGLAQAAERGGADAVTVGAGLVGMKVDAASPDLSPPCLVGQLTGPAVRPLAVWHVSRVSCAVRIPVIGGGGITSTADALELLLAGASAVQVGTATFVEPTTATQIVDELPAALAALGCRSVSELVGRVAQRAEGEA